MSVIVNKSTAEMCTIDNQEGVLLLGDVSVKSRKVGKDFVYFIQEKIEKLPEFLPFIYNIPSLNIKLNLIREKSDDLFEFGGALDNKPVCGFLSFTNNRITTTLTYLHNQEALVSFEAPRQTKLQIA